MQWVRTSLADYPLISPAVYQGFCTCPFVQPEPWNEMFCRLGTIDVEPKTHVGEMVEV